MNITFTTIKTDQEIQQLLDLQQLNLTKNISEDVANDQGFVTVVHNFDLLSRMNQSVPQIIAKYGDKVIGYALVMPESFRFDIPVLTAMFELMDGLEYKEKLIKDTELNKIVSKAENHDKDWEDFNIQFESINKNFFYG